MLRQDVQRVFMSQRLVRPASALHALAAIARSSLKAVVNGNSTVDTTTGSGESVAEDEVRVETVAGEDDEEGSKEDDFDTTGDESEKMPDRKDNGSDGESLDMLHGISADSVVSASKVWPSIVTGRLEQDINTKRWKEDATTSKVWQK